MIGGFERCKLCSRGGVRHVEQSLGVCNPHGGRGDARHMKRSRPRVASGHACRWVSAPAFREHLRQFRHTYARKSGVILAKSGTFPRIRAVKGSRCVASVSRMARRTRMLELCKPLTCGFFSASRRAPQVEVEKCPILPNGAARVAPSLLCACRTAALPIRGQPHETCANRHRPGAAKPPSKACRRGNAPTPQLGDLWRFRKANLLLDKEWREGSMNIVVHRPLTAAPSQPQRACKIVASAARRALVPARGLLTPRPCASAPVDVFC